MLTLRLTWPAGMISAALVGFCCGGPLPSYSLSAPDLGGIANDPFLLAERDDALLSADQTSTDLAPVELPLQWMSRHRSTQACPIETARLGDGPRRVVVLSSLHGNETQSLSLVTQLAKHLSANPDLIAGQSILFIRSPNPDGVQAKTALNPRGVDLNRNFPSNNWKTLPKNRSGVRIGSEAETRAVVSILEEFRPELLIHVKDLHSASLINAEGTARPKAEAMAAEFSWKEAHDLGQITSGSLEHFAHSRLNCHCLTLLAQRQSTPEAAWEAHHRVLLSAVDDLVPAQAEATTSRRRQSQAASSRTTLTDDSDEAIFPGRTRPLADEGDGPIPESGYIELPPSPNK